MLHILVADDHPLVRRHVRDALAAEEGWNVCCEAATGREAVEMAALHKPDIAVLDFSMPELNGLEAGRQILEIRPQTHVLILTMHEPEELMREALASGARTCVVKSDLQHMVNTLRSLLQQNPPCASREPDSVKEAPDRLTAGEAEPSSPVELTRQEREIVRLIAESRSDKEIAASLSISVQTVETDRAAIMRKLRMNSTIDLVRYALREKLVEVERMR